MRVAVKNMSGDFIHSTTPRKARLLLKEKKAVIESQDPFTIRLLFSESECGLKDSESLNKLNSGLLSEKDITMCGNEEVKVLVNNFNEYHTFTLQSIRHILNSTDVDRVTWYMSLGKTDPDSFANTLYSAGLTLFRKNHRVMGNFVLTGKQGFDILRKMGHPRFDFEGRYGTIDSSMKVHYIPSMDDNSFIISVYENLNFKDNDDYKVYYKMYKNMDAMVVGEIVDDETSNENLESKSGINDKCKTVSTNTIKHDSKTHLIFGAYGCGKTTLLAKLVRDRLNNGEQVARVLYNKNKDVHSKLFHAENGAFCTLVEFRGKGAYSPVEASNYLMKACEFPASITAIVLDDMNKFLIHSDYDHQEYFREFSRVCRENNIDFICTLGVDSDKNEVYHKLPEIYARFSDTITVLK